MKRQFLSVKACRRFAAALLRASLVLGTPALADDDDDDDDGFGGGQTIDIVRCWRGESINEAIQPADPLRPLLVEIRGVCDENVTVDRDDVTLQGRDPMTDGIRGVPEVDPEKEGPITVSNGAGTVIENLTVSNGGSSGISVVNSTATITNVIAENNGNLGFGGGIFVGAGGFVSISDATIQDNQQEGLIAARGGVAVIVDSLIQNNQDDGILAVDNGVVRVGIDRVQQIGPVTIQDNGGHGMSIGQNATAMVRSSTITGNLGNGIELFRSASAFVQDNTISGNSPDGPDYQGGVAAFQGSTVELRNNQITNHPNGYGVQAVDNSVARMGDNTVDGSGANVGFGAGVAAFRNSSLRMFGGNTVINSGWAAVDFEQMSVFRASGGSGETLTQAPGLGPNGEGPKLVIQAFNKAMVDIRGGSVVTGEIRVAVQSTLRSRSNTVTGDIGVFANSGLGLRNTVTYASTITCDGLSFTFSNNGGPYDCNTSH